MTTKTLDNVDVIGNQLAVEILSRRLQIVVGYHDNCMDGLVSAYAVTKWMRRYNLMNVMHSSGVKPQVLTPVMRALQHGFEPDYQELLDTAYEASELGVESCLILVDFSYTGDQLTRLLEIYQYVVIVDHHAGQADLNVEHYPEIPTHVGKTGLIHVFDLKKSGAMLSYLTFMGARPDSMLYEYVQDRDLWQKRLPNTEMVSLYLRGSCVKIDDLLDAESLLRPDRISMAVRKVIVPFAENMQKVERAIVQRCVVDTFKMQPLVRLWPNSVYAQDSVPVVRLPKVFVSDCLHDLLGQYPTAPFAIGLSDVRGGTVSVSLRSRTGQRVDCIDLVRDYGGGGHYHAAGFQLSQADTARLFYR